MLFTIRGIIFVSSITIKKQKMKILYVIWPAQGDKYLEMLTKEEADRLYPKDSPDYIAVWPARPEDVIMRN